MPEQLSESMARKALKEGYADKGLPVLSMKRAKKKTARKR